MRARDYQERQFTRLIQDDHRHRYLCVACASGKTFVGLALLQHEMRETAKYTHALILSPTQVVRNGWATSNMGENRRHFECSEFSVIIDADLILNVDDDVVNVVLNYLLNPNPRKVALSLCHASWDPIMRALEDQHFDASRMLLGIDEHHHSAADSFARGCQLWEQAGGSFFGLTATPFRLDGREVFPRGASVYYRSMSQQMDEGFAPRNLNFKFEPLLLDRDVSDPENIERAAQGLVNLIVADRDPESGLLPKFTVYVPGQGRLGEVLDENDNEGAHSSGTYLLVQRFKELLQEWLRENADPSQQDQVIMDVTNGPGQTHNFLHLLDLERECQRWDQSQVLGVMGCRRMIEGIDWKWASACYMCSVSSSAGLVVQFVGRGQRCKADLEQYQACWQNVTLFRALTPMFQDTRMDHADMVTKMALILGDIRHGTFLSHLIHHPETSTARVVPARRDPEASPSSESDQEGERNTRGRLPEDFLVGRLMHAESRATLLSYVFSCLQGEIYRVWEARQRLLSQGVSEEDANWILVEIILRNHPERQREWVQLIQDNEWRRLPRLQVEHALAALVDDCREEHIVLERVPQFQHAMRERSHWTPEPLRMLARRLDRELLSLDTQTFRDWGVAYYQEHGSWPSRNTPGGPEEGESWSRLHNAVRHGARGLHRSSSLQGAFIYYDGEGSVLEILENGFQLRIDRQWEDIEQRMAAYGYPAVASIWPNYLSARLALGNPYPRDLFLHVGVVPMCVVLGSSTARRYGRSVFQAFRRELERQIREGVVFTEGSLRQLFNYYRPDFGLADADASTVDFEV